MIWLFQILRIYREEHLLIKYYLEKYLILLKTQNMKQINVKLFQSFKSVLIKSLLVVLLHVQINLVLKLKLCQINNLLKDHTRQLLKNLKNKIYTQDKIWDANLVDRQLISKYNEGLQVLLCVIDVFSTYA